MKIKILFLTIILCLNANILASKPRIVTSVTPVAAIVAMILKDIAIIDSIATNNGCPHHYNLKPSDLNKVQNADIAIYIDDEFDNFAERLMKTHSKDVIKLSDINTLRIIKNNDRANWHVWLDLENTQVILQELAKIFVQKFPLFQKDISKNLANALEQIANLKNMKNDKFQKITDAILLTDSAEYLFLDTNIRLSKIYSTDQKSLKHISKINDMLNNSTNKCLILSSNQNPKIYQKLKANIVALESENWPELNVSPDTFYNQYLEIINNVANCETNL